MKHSFRNDYSEIAHPEILKLLLDNAYSQHIGYGFDNETEEFKKMLSLKTTKKVEVFMLTGGTQVNLTLISKALNDYEACICVKSGHINVHETGAVEATGHKIITVDGINGKITVDEIKNVVALHTDCHMVKPHLVYISNSTEIGTIYTLQELKDIYHICQALDLLLFIDGARLAVALDASRDTTLNDIIEYSDAFYIGGTKNGLPYGEALVITNNDLSKDFAYHLKNKGAMLSKTYIVSMMFNYMFSTNLFYRLAKNANEMANYIKKSLIENNVKVIYNNPTNQVFVKINKEIALKLQTDYDFEIWGEESDAYIIRIVTSWATSIEACQMLIESFKKEIKSNE